MKTILFLIIGLFAFTSCKKCDPSNSSGGEIIDNAIVKVIYSVPNPILVTDSSQVNFPIEVSLDNQISFEPIDFTKYSLLAFPTTASCSSGYDRVVVKNAADQSVTYTITITECETCEGNVYITNWVLIPAVPSNYSPIFVLN